MTKTFKTSDDLLFIMYDSTHAIGMETIYLRLKDLGTEICPYCGSKVKELYPDSGHSFATLRGWRNLITYWYSCTNPDCSSGGKFKAPQAYVIPYKKFGQDVWLNICFEWEKWKTAPKEISERLACQGVYISEDTVSVILKDYKMLKNKHTNKKTLEIVSKQGKMAIGCDGTPIEAGSPMLWTFYDVFSGRMLYATLLNSANVKTLKNIFITIKDMYGVPITAFLSDHQPSIVKACKEFDPIIPHQTCHYHFLRNHWVFLKEKDTHMNKELRKVVNNLPIAAYDANGGAIYTNNLKIQKKDFFQPLYSHLKKIVYQRDDEFKRLKGILAYEKLSETAKEIHKELQTLDLELRPTKQLIKTQILITDALNAVKSEYMNLKELFEHFQVIRGIIGDPTTKKQEKINGLESYYSMLFKKYSPDTKYESREDIKSQTAKFDDNFEEIICQWCRLWDSHKENLFFYYDVEGLEKTNIYNEQIFSLVKRAVVRAHGRAHKNYMVFTQGDIYSTNICDKKSVNIQEILTSYDLKEIAKLYEPIQTRIDIQRNKFRNSSILNTSIKDIADKIRNKVWEN